jgi:hypothetical protein
MTRRAGSNCSPPRPAATTSRRLVRSRATLLWQSVLAVLLSCVPVAHGHALRRLQDPDEPTRVTVGPFSLQLAPTPFTFNPDALDLLYVYIQQTLLEYMNLQAADSGLNVLYFVMTDIGLSEMDGDVSTLRIGEGAAAFGAPGENAGSVPSDTQVESWIRAAIDTQLVGHLEETEFYYVQEARFVSLTGDRGAGAGALQEEEEPPIVTTSGGGSNIALSASVAVAGAAVLLLGALLVKSQRQRHSETATPVLGSASLDRGAPPSMSPRRYQPAEEQASSPSPARSGRTDPDSRSLADSDVSSWTAGTEMGDSAALQSIATNQYAIPAVVATESFEHERQVYVQKDMLTTVWSGRNGVSPGALTVPQDSVLTPSHFSASQERHRRQWTDQDAAPRPFVFASNDDIGEEVFLMPESEHTRGGPHAELL